MGVRTGKQYVEGLRDDRRIYINGEIVRDVTKISAACRGHSGTCRASTIASMSKASKRS